MNEVNPNRIKFYEFLNDDIEKEELENWVNKTDELNQQFPQDHYLDLISFSFKTGDLKAYITKLVEVFFDWQEYEKWLTIKLLTEIINDEIGMVSATQKLRQLYFDQENRIQMPLISFRLGIEFESILEDCPSESEYENWNNDALKKQLEPFERFKEEVRDAAKKRTF